jgi:hypothetical protein
MPVVKQCTHCGELKVLEQFPKATTCADGHRSYCKACKKQAQDVWRNNNKGKHCTKSKTWAKQNKEKRTKTSRTYRLKNKTKCAALTKAWKIRNRARVNISTAMRRKRLQKATPVWADKAKIKQVYEQAQIKKLEVDHIIPLRGKLVSGLHVHNNLRLVTKTENSAKGNKYALQE